MNCDNINLKKKKEKGKSIESVRGLQTSLFFSKQIIYITNQIIESTCNKNNNI